MVAPRICRCHPAIVRILAKRQNRTDWRGTFRAGGRCSHDGPRGENKEATMPILLWLLGVPLSIVILLMLFGVVSF